MKQGCGMGADNLFKNSLLSLNLKTFFETNYQLTGLK